MLGSFLSRFVDGRKGVNRRTVRLDKKKGGQRSRTRGAFEALEARTLLAMTPIMNLPLNEMSGTTAVDSSGYGNHGTLYNGPVWTTG